MQLSLGIDTGGTYTDAVVFADGVGVIASAKARTTRHDLTLGIDAAIDAVLGDPRTRAAMADGSISLVSLSTTLATNAIVEGRGGQVALVMIGFDDDAVGRGGLDAALAGDPVIRIGGGHDPHGNQRAPLDVPGLAAAATAVAPTVTGFAITAQFATRNPAHEIDARDVIREATGLPVTCGHELSAQLDGPRRAVTSVLNARLIGLLTQLIDAARTTMDRAGITAPLMVVRGDGSLMAADVAVLRPIETILSGPAASAVGATFLTGLAHAVVADIGGTTTDVAVIVDNAPRLDRAGATVGGHRTMVEAVAMTTIGLGGDSEVRVDDRSVTATLTIGPRRVLPISLLALDHPEVVHGALDRQLDAEVPSPQHARFVVPVADHGATATGLDPTEVALLRRLGATAQATLDVMRSPADEIRLDRLVTRGLVQLSCFTPTDAAHVLADQAGFDHAASQKAATLLSRIRSAVGTACAPSGTDLAERVLTQLRRRSAELILDVALGIDGTRTDPAATNTLLRTSLDRQVGLVDVAARVTVPVVGLGASAALHYGNVAALVRADSVVPEHAEVANAVGAVVGSVRVAAHVGVSRLKRERFRVHHPDDATDHDDLTEALVRAEELARADALDGAVRGGAEDPHVTIERNLNVIQMEGIDYFVDATISAVATGRPRLR